LLDTGRPLYQEILYVKLPDVTTVCHHVSASGFEHVLKTTLCNEILGECLRQQLDSI